MSATFSWVDFLKHSASLFVECVVHWFRAVQGHKPTSPLDLLNVFEHKRDVFVTEAFIGLCIVGRLSIVLIFDGEEMIGKSWALNFHSLLSVFNDWNTLNSTDLSKNLGHVCFRERTDRVDCHCKTVLPCFKHIISRNQIVRKLKFVLVVAEHFRHKSFLPASLHLVRLNATNITIKFANEVEHLARELVNGFHFARSRSIEVNQKAEVKLHKVETILHGPDGKLLVKALLKSHFGRWVFSQQ